MPHTSRTTFSKNHVIVIIIIVIIIIIIIIRWLGTMWDKQEMPAAV